MAFQTIFPCHDGGKFVLKNIYLSIFWLSIPVIFQSMDFCYFVHNDNKQQQQQQALHDVDRFCSSWMKLNVVMRNLRTQFRETQLYFYLRLTDALYDHHNIVFLTDI